MQCNCTVKALNVDTREKTEFIRVPHCFLLGKIPFFASKKVLMLWRVSYILFPAIYVIILSHRRQSHDLKVFAKVINHGFDAFVQERIFLPLCVQVRQHYLIHFQRWKIKSEAYNFSNSLWNLFKRRRHTTELKTNYL